MEKVTYAKIMGLARDENNLPTFGYMKMEGVQLRKETLATLMHTTPDAVVMLTAEEYQAETDEKCLEPGDTAWVVERDEKGCAYAVSGYMFLAEACRYAIVSIYYISGATTAPQNLAGLAWETAGGKSSSLCVFPMADVFTDQEKALEVLRSELEAAHE